MREHARQHSPNKRLQVDETYDTVPKYKRALYKLHPIIDEKLFHPDPIASNGIQPAVQWTVS